MIERAPILGNVLLAISYFLLGEIALLMTTLGGVYEVFWAPSGVGLALVLLHGLRWWPGIAAGTFLTMVVRTDPTSATLVAMINVGCVVVAYSMLYRLLQFRPQLDRVRDVVALAVVIVVVAIIGATLGAGALRLHYHMEARELLSLGATWWWSHLSGDLIVAPVILTWARRVSHQSAPSRRVEAIALAAVGTIVLVAIIARHLPTWLPHGTAPFYLLPLLAWAGVRFGPHVAATASLVVGLACIVAGAFRLGPFMEVADMQSFVAISAVSTLMLSALANERVAAVQRRAAIQLGALDAIVSVDHLGRIVELNPAAERLFKLDANALGRDVATLMVPPRLRAAFHAQLRQYVTDGTSPLVGTRFRSTAWNPAESREFPIELSVTRAPIDGETVLTAFIRDITAEHAAETTRQESRIELERRVEVRTRELLAANRETERRAALLRQAEELAHIGSFEFDVVTQRLKWSDELYRIYGRDPKEFEPTYERMISAVHPDDRKHVRDAVANAIERQQPMTIEERIVRPDGSVRTLVTQARVIRTGESHVIGGCCQDITERNRSDEQRSRLIQVVETSVDAIIMLSPWGQIETWNTAAATLFGYSSEEMVGQPYAVLVPESARDQLATMLEEVWAGKQRSHYEMVHVRRDGTQLDASVTTSTVLDYQARVIGIAQILRDLSDQKRVEKQLRQSLDEKEVLLREIHHRVKNNLQVISSLLNLQSTNRTSAAARDVLLDSQNRIGSMALVHQLLYQSNDVGRIDFSEYIRTLVARLVDTYNVGPDRVTTSVNAVPISLDIDRAIPCGLVLNELVTNALTHAFPEGHAGHLAVTLESIDDTIMLTVKDDGVGLPPELDIATSSTFGLRIAHTLARQLDGELTVTRNSGTTARIVFPTLGAHVMTGTRG